MALTEQERAKLFLAEDKLLAIELIVQEEFDLAIDKIKELCKPDLAKLVELKNPYRVSDREFKCASCGTKYPDNFCSTNDVRICRWCSGEEK